MMDPFILLYKPNKRLKGDTIMQYFCSITNVDYSITFVCVYWVASHMDMYGSNYIFFMVLSNQMLHLKGQTKRDGS